MKIFGSQRRIPNLEAMLRNLAACLCVVACCLVATGCGDSGETTTTVSGAISYKGKPVTSGLINFLATGGRPMGGAIGADGAYEFELPPGDYQVRIDAPPPLPEGFKEGDPLTNLGPRPLPEKYANFNTSGLTATVTAGEAQTIDFALP